MTAAQILLAELEAIGYAKDHGLTDYVVVICDELPAGVAA